MYLNMSSADASAANNCLTLLTNLNIEANRVGPRSDCSNNLGPHC